MMQPRSPRTSIPVRCWRDCEFLARMSKIEMEPAAACDRRRPTASAGRRCMPKVKQRHLVVVRSLGLPPLRTKTAADRPTYVHAELKIK
jgi:hypothetical protein